MGADNRQMSDPNGRVAIARREVQNFSRRQALFNYYNIYNSLQIIPLLAAGRPLRYNPRMLTRNGILIAAVRTGLVSALLYAGAAAAEFDLNWTADTPNPTFSGTVAVHGTVNIPGQTPFIYERVQDQVGTYYHMVIGDESTGFAQEVYIQIGAALQPVQGFGQIGREFSSSGGAPLPGGNAVDPLGSNAAFTGNSSGDPRRVQMRQIVEDDELSMDFLKDRYDEKPSISNTIESSDLSARFEMNSSGNSYSDGTTPSVVTNTVEHLDPDVPPASAVFDMAVDAQNPNVTAGLYTHPARPQPGGQGGDYVYTANTTNPQERESVELNPDWGSFFDHREANPWSYPTNRPTP